MCKAKGYSDAWIEIRLRDIEIREQLTKEWDKHGVKEGKEYKILTAKINKATFGMTQVLTRSTRDLNAKISVIT